MSRAGRLIPQPMMASPGSDSMPASLVDASSTYKFKLSVHDSFQSSVIGVLSGYISCSPSVSSFSEWSTLIALFNEVRLVRARLRMASINPYDTNMQKFGLPVAWDDSLSSTAGGSIDTVMSHADTRVFHLASRIMEFDVKCSSRQWATTSSPAPGPYAGCTGEFQFYASGLTVSSYYFEYFLDIEVEMRNRA